VKRILGLGLLCWALTAFPQTGEDRREWPKTDFSKRTVELAEIESGGPPKDGIPAIDRPRFVGTPAARLAEAGGAGHRAAPGQGRAGVSAADPHVSRDRERHGGRYVCTLADS
jgi:hypothetical protein